MAELNLQSKISELNGIGSKRAAAFEKMGVFTLQDLLRFFPRRYQNRGAVKDIFESEHKSVGSFILTVATVPKTARLRGKKFITKFNAYDDSGACEIVFYNQPYVCNSIKVGERYRFYGRVEIGKYKRTIVSPAYDKVSEDLPLKDLIPVYRSSEGLTRKPIEMAVKEALSVALPELSDPLPEEVRRRLSLSTIQYAIKNMHDPEDYDSLNRAGRRIVFDDILYYMLAIGMSASVRKSSGGRCFADTDISPLLDCLPFELTNAQKRVVEEIKGDLSGERYKNKEFPPMSRILVGDVGSGKTVCAVAAIYIAAKNGVQSALMVPTEVLANQHYKDIAPLLSRFGIKTELLTGSVTLQKKREIKERLMSCEADRIDLLIGTHALIGEGYEYRDLGLVITDEQHRFGVSQRAALGEKGQSAHLLVMSATPIPRTLTLALYGDLDISRIDEMPKGRQRVDTFVVGESYRARLNAFIRKNVDEGGQVYIVCPTVEEKEEDEDGDEIGDILFEKEDAPPLKAAVSYASELQNELPDIPICFLHGRMKAKEKDEVMTRFANGEIKVLVSTTVIEVGVNVPTATLMIVENAERFGLSQLHQLRGRVGRGIMKSYCVLVSDAKGETARKRLDVIRTTYDGYTIAEKDLQLRGPGDFFSQKGKYRQHGDSGAAIMSQWGESDIFSIAEREASRMIKSGDIYKKEYQALLSDVTSSYKIDFNAAN